MNENKMRTRGSIFGFSVPKCLKQKRCARGAQIKLFVKILVHAHDSFACTTLLCIHNTLVHALGEGPSQARGQGPGLGPKKRAVQGLGPAQRRF